MQEVLKIYLCKKGYHFHKPNPLKMKNAWHREWACFDAR